MLSQDLKIIYFSTDENLLWENLEVTRLRDGCLLSNKLCDYSGKGMRESCTIHIFEICQP
jgi:hypothetical protein